MGKFYFCSSSSSTSSSNNSSIGRGIANVHKHNNNELLLKTYCLLDAAHVSLFLHLSNVYVALCFHQYTHQHILINGWSKEKCLPIYISRLFMINQLTLTFIKISTNHHHHHHHWMQDLKSSNKKNLANIYITHSHFSDKHPCVRANTRTHTHITNRRKRTINIY